MKIPVGNFGYHTATLESGKTPPAQAFVNNSLSSLADSGLKVSTDLMESNAKAKALEASTGFQNDALDIGNAIETKLKNKEIRREDVQPLLDKQISDLRKKRLEGQADAYQPSLSSSFDATTGGVKRQLDKAIETDLKEETVAAMSNTVESLHRLALTDPHKAISQADTILDTQGKGILGADKIQAAKQSFREKASFSYLSKQIVDNRDSIKGLQGVVSRINSDEFASLDPDKRTTLVSHAETMIDRNIARAEAAQKRKEAQLERGIKEVSQVMMAGYPVDPSSIATLEQAAKGTIYESEIKSLRSQVDYVSKFTSASPAQMEAELNRLDSEMHKPGAKVTPEMIGMKNKLETLRDTTVKQLQENPMGYAVSQGWMPATPIDFSNPQNLPSQIQARVDVAYGLNKQYGSPLKILFPQEADNLSKYLNAAPVESKLQYIEAIHNGVKDPAVFRSVMGQIAPDSPNTAWGAVLYGMGRESVTTHWFKPDEVINGKTAAVLLFRGESMLNPGKNDKQNDGKTKGFPMPSEKDMNQEFSSMADAAFPGASQVRDQMYQASKAIYAAMSADAGDYAGQINSERFRRAVKLATGGIGSYNGADVMLPYAMPEDKFNDEANKRVKALVQSGRLDKSLTEDRLMNLPLMSANGNGRYFLRAGDALVMDKNGPVILDFNEPLPVLPEAPKPVRRTRGVQR